MDKSAYESNRKKVAIVGLANTGKTQVFNNLTESYNIVSNCPLTTINIQRKNCLINNEPYEIIDTPGIYKLNVHSQADLITRDLIWSETPDVIIQCIDANQLKQSLMLTADLLELGVSLVIALNAIDETSKKGIWIDSLGLTRLLHVPFVESIAVNGQGTEELKDAINKAKRNNWNFQYEDKIEKAISAIESMLPENVPYKRKESMLLLMDDPYIAGCLIKRFGEEKVAPAIKKANDVRRKFMGNVNQVIIKKQGKWIDDIIERVVKRQEIEPREFLQGFARLCRHPVFGIPIFLIIVYAMYFLVVNVANNIAEWMGNVIWVPIENMVTGIIPAGFWLDFLIGDYGILSLGLANAIITVLPVLSVFFLMFNIMEDIGYIPNLCVLTKKIIEKLGLSGSAVMPMVLGFGCKTMATLTTKTLHSEREKYIAIYLIAFAIPCAPQMGLNMSILGRMSIAAFLIVFSVLIFVEIAAGMILNKMLKKEAKSDYIQELPPMRLPSPKAVIVKTYYRLYWFLKEAIPVFIYAALALFALDKSGILDATKFFLSPVIKGLLGLPLEMVDALILCMARHEAAAGLIINLVDKGKLDFIQCIVAVTITTMFVPCFANIMAMINELKIKKALIMTAIINLSAFIIAGILNWTLNGIIDLF